SARSADAGRPPGGRRRRAGPLTSGTIAGRRQCHTSQFRNPPPGKTMRRAATMLLVPLLALAACGGEGPPPAPPPPELGVVVVQPGDAQLKRDLVGRLAAYRSADVRARVPGVLQRRVYQEGSDVREGQVLFEIDPAPLRAASSEAQAALAQ